MFASIVRFGALLLAAACSSDSMNFPSAAAGNSGTLAQPVAGTSAGAAAGSGDTPTPAGGRGPIAGAGTGAMTGRAGGPAAGSRGGGSGSSGGSSLEDDGGTPPGLTPPTAGSGSMDGPATGPFPPVTDFKSNGPFEGTQLNNAGPNNNFTIYLPKQLAPNGTKNPIIVWMSGGGTTPVLYPLLPLLATHGFVVLASNTVPGIGAEIDLGKEMVAAIDWAFTESMKQGGQFAGKLDTTKVAAMGYSMGSLATFTIASDPRLTTTVHISGGNMVAGRVNNLKMPAAFFCGTPDPNCTDILSDQCDIAAANCDTDFEMAKTPVFYGNFPGGHLGVLSEPNQPRIQAEVVAWLRWQLMADTTIKSRFVGPTCGVCTDMNWKAKQKNLQ
jgi:dienelactone hydrolase